ncbi:CPBP family intramembrane metalloprotease [Clostridium sporogenes]|nr:CPBP family intramembrane metalloprotease [Clostridium sporogenes]
MSFVKEFYIISIIFGLIHLNIPQCINATIIGIFLGVIYYTTRSLVLRIVGYMVNSIIFVLDIPSNIISFFVGAVIFLSIK